MRQIVGLFFFIQRPELSQFLHFYHYWFKTDRYLKNFQENLFGLLRL